MEKRRSPWIPVVLSIAIGIMVTVLLNNVVRPTSVVVAKVALSPGTRLTADLLELRTIPAQALPKDALVRIEDAQDKTLVVGRAPGDFLLTSILGEASQAGIPANLASDHLAVAVPVALSSGLAGLLREGQTVTLVGVLSPEVLQNVALPSVPVTLPSLEEPTAPIPGQPTPVPSPTPTPAPPAAPLARIAVSGVKVLLVPQSFRYEELPPGSTEEQLFASSRTVSAAQEGSVVVLDVPASPVELVPGMLVNPATLVVALSQYGTVYLTLEPAGGFQPGEILTLNLADLYDALNDSRRE
jgi:Flp pilus assembly protein CpaB